MALIKLTKGLSTLVDDDLFSSLNSHKWHALGPKGKERPARKLSNGRYIYLYHEVLEVLPWELGGLHVDHINRILLDNRKANLRIVTPSENQYNSERVKNSQGIGYDRTHDRYKAYVGSGSTRTNIGTFAVSMRL